MKFFTKFDGIVLILLGSIMTLDIVLFCLDAGAIGMIIQAVLPIIALALSLYLMIMRFESPRGMFSYILGFVCIHWVDLSTVLWNNRGMYTTLAHPNYDEIALAPVIIKKIVMLAAAVILVVCFGRHRGPAIEAANYKDYLRKLFFQYVSPAGERRDTITGLALLACILFWLMVGLSTGSAVDRMMTLSNAERLADTRYPYGLKTGYVGSPFATILCGLIVMGIGFASWTYDRYMERRR